MLQTPAQYLRDGLSVNALRRVAAALSDTESAQRMQRAKATLFQQLRVSA